MKILLSVLAGICMIAAAIATPVAIVFGAYQWGGNGLEFQVALWSAVKLWGTMLVMIVPGLIFAGISYLIS